MFLQRLGLTPEETLRPTHPEIMIAYGAALSLDGMFAGNSSWYMPKHYLELLENPELRAHLQASADWSAVFRIRKKNIVHLMNAINSQNLHLMYRKRAKRSMLILALIPAVRPRNLC